jgi:hypothetical protein
MKTVEAALKLLASKYSAGEIEERNKAFARSLLDSSTDRALTPKQIYWVQKLAGVAAAKPVEDYPVNPSKLYEHLDKARGVLKYPSIRLGVDMQDYTVSLGRGNAIWVTHTRVDGEELIGRIDTIDRKFIPLQPEGHRVAQIIKALCEDPEGVIERFGLK